jgi:hypothetical protein
VAALNLTLASVESEFCVASGARLNRSKTRVLLLGNHPQPWPTSLAGAAVLQQGDSVKSLGAICSPSANAPGRLPEVLSAMERKLQRLAKLTLSLHARALLANAVLASCLWYFVQFEQLPASEEARATQVVWKCVWHESSSGSATRWEVKRARVCAPATFGGMGVIEPAVMVQALLARAVNLVLAGRGQWWSVWSEALVERAARTGAGTGFDGLAYAAARPRIAAACPPYWRAALEAWSKLQLQQPAEPPSWLPPVSAGAVLAGLRARAGAPASHTAAIDCFAASGMAYAADFWNRQEGRWVSPSVVLQRSQQARLPGGVDYFTAIDAFTRIRAGVTPAEKAALRAAVVPAAGRVYRIRGEQACARATEVGDAGSSGCIHCSSKHSVTVALLDLPGGMGSIGSDAAERTLCSCSLSPLATNQEVTMAWGEAESTALIPALLNNKAAELTLESDVATLRRFFRRSMQPESEQRPGCEAAWQALIAPEQMSEGQWEKAWWHVHAAQLDGKLRSLMWRVLHRRLPLLSLQWYRDWLQRPACCALCSSGDVETTEHLFSSCATVAAVWRQVSGWLQGTAWQRLPHSATGWSAQ